MHLVITDIPSSAAPGHQALRGALSNTPLPHLARLLTDLQPAGRIELDEFAWTMPHEILLARALGLPQPSTPWAAWETAHTSTPCAWIHPSHWQVGIDHITMSAPSGLQFDESASREHCAVLAPFFAEVGIVLTYHEPLRWLATGEVFADLPCASIDRVVGRNIDAWMAEAASPAGAQMRRLQNEVQMLLYQHPLTERAQAAARLPMNSFWISGAGRLDAPPVAITPHIDRSLQTPVWTQDASAYRKAWQALDAGVLADLGRRLDAGQAISLSLCSDSTAQCLEVAPSSLGRRLRRLLGGAPRADWSRWL